MWLGAGKVIWRNASVLPVPEVLHPSLAAQLHPDPSTSQLPWSKTGMCSEPGLKARWGPLPSTLMAPCITEGTGSGALLSPFSFLPQAH